MHSHGGRPPPGTRMVEGEGRRRWGFAPPQQGEDRAVSASMPRRTAAAVSASVLGNREDPRSTAAASRGCRGDQNEMREKIEAKIRVRILYISTMLFYGFS